MEAGTIYYESPLKEHYELKITILHTRFRSLWIKTDCASFWSCEDHEYPEFVSSSFRKRPKRKKK